MIALLAAFMAARSEFDAIILGCLIMVLKEESTHHEYRDTRKSLVVV